jgi:6-phosphogluconate dehydrogenase
MGSEMAQLFAEKGLAVSVFDVATSNVDQLEHNLDTTDKVSDDVRQHIHLFKDYAAFVESLGGKDARKLYLLSIRHGSAADEVIQSLKEADALTKGDVILDGGNEWYRSTERRQSELAKLGVQYVGLGVSSVLALLTFTSSVYNVLISFSKVSGGYQSARRGPSFSPGGDEDTIKQLLPLLEACAARDPDSSDNTPCVAYIGPAGSGHYVKMAHNGIEQGMLGVLAESWEMMFKCLHMKLENIAEQYESWTVDANSELVRHFISDVFNLLCCMGADEHHRLSLYSATHISSRSPSLSADSPILPATHPTCSTASKIKSSKTPTGPRAPASGRSPRPRSGTSPRPPSPRPISYVWPLRIAQSGSKSTVSSVTTSEERRNNPSRRRRDRKRRTRR